MVFSTFQVDNLVLGTKSSQHSIPSNSDPTARSIATCSDFPRIQINLSENPTINNVLKARGLERKCKHATPHSFFFKSSWDYLPSTLFEVLKRQQSGVFRG